jgi:hypothetical protein
VSKQLLEKIVQATSPDAVPLAEAREMVPLERYGRVWESASAETHEQNAPSQRDLDGMVRLATDQVVVLRTRVGAELRTALEHFDDAAGPRGDGPLSPPERVAQEDAALVRQQRAARPHLRAAEAHVREWIARDHAAECGRCWAPQRVFTGDGGDAFAEEPAGGDAFAVEPRAAGEGDRSRHGAACDTRRRTAHMVTVDALVLLRAAVMIHSSFFFSTFTKKSREIQLFHACPRRLAHVCIGRSKVPCFRVHTREFHTVLF